MPESSKGIRAARSRGSGLALIALTALLTGGCGEANPDDAPADASSSSAMPPSGSPADAPTDSLMQTASTDFTLRADGPIHRLDIPYRYRNTTGATVYLVNCNGDVSPALDRLEDDRWVRAWSPEMNGCLSPPVVIHPGALYSDTLRFAAGLDGNPSYNQMAWVGESGVFRLNWEQALSSFDADTHPFGPKIEVAHRVSNPFTIRRP